VRRALRVDGVEHLLGQPRHELPAHGRDRVSPPPGPGSQERRPRVVILGVHPLRSAPPSAAPRPSRSPLVWPRLPLAIRCGQGRVASSPVCGALRMEGGKWQRPPYRTPRVLRRAVAPAYAYKRGLPGAGYNANGHGARSAHGSCSASPRDRAVHGSESYYQDQNRWRKRYYYY